MPDWLSIHEPVLVNTIGHCAGAAIFGMLLYFLLVNWRQGREQRRSLPVVAATLALLWNVGSLVALALGPARSAAGNLIVTASFAVLSLLPAVLLHISLGSRHGVLRGCGYALGGAAILLHFGDLATESQRLHFAGVIVVIVGFSVLTLLSIYLELLEAKRAAVSRLAGAMGLLLFAISFAHFGSGHARQVWSSEAALHHAGLPLALFVLLHDYRFLLMDAFLRFVVNASLAAAALLIAIRVVEMPQLLERLRDPFTAGILFVGAGLLLALFVYLHNRMQGLLTRVLFLRPNVDRVLQELNQAARSARGETEYLRCAAEAISRFLRAAPFDLTDQNPLPQSRLTAPAAVTDPSNWNVPGWVQAVVPLRFARGDTQYLLFGRRDGGRRFLSEDFALLMHLAAAVSEHVEQFRAIEMQHLVSRAELSALQAQINPHFLFNALNTLYGTIDRKNAHARQLVLNLSDVFRYLLRSDRTFIEIEEELRIIRAYLEIEELRLGPKLHTEIVIDDSARRATIPLLAIQPLVENAVKHGVAVRAVNGFVRLSVTSRDDAVCVRVSNSGECDARALGSPGSGIGLANVRRRLELCYGPEARLEAASEGGVTTVGFTLPMKPAERMPAAV